MAKKNNPKPNRARPLARFSGQFGVSRALLKSEGAFDTYLERDSPFSIHPKLLDKTTAPEFKNARADVLKTFDDVVDLLEASTKHGDAMWKTALSLFDFPEFRGASLGFSARSGDGRGWRLKERLNTLQTAKEIIDAGVKNPRIFELVGLFQEGVGPDMVSDMLGNILLDKVISFTQRVSLNVAAKPMVEHDVEGFGKALLPTYMDSKGKQRYTLLVPRDILSDLPEVLAKSDIGEAAAHSAAVRHEMNQRFGRHWRKHFESKKTLVRQSMIDSKSFTERLIAQYERKPIRKYDVEKDPLDKISWLERAKELGEQQPASLSVTTLRTAADAQTILRELIAHFKHLVEHTNAKRLLYHKNGLPRDEKSVQYLFQAVALTQSLFTKLNVSPEVNSGRGPVDFKFSLSTDVTVLVEIKVSSNGKLVDGLLAQLPTYMHSESAEHGFYLVVDLGAKSSAANIARLQSQIAKHPNTPPNVDVVICDARPKPSASKLRATRTQ